MKVGVTGGNGFIGTHICNELRSRGHEVLVLDHKGRCNGAGDPVMLADVRDSSAVKELAAHVDGVIHLAAVLGTQETIGDPGPAAEVNILGGVNVLGACKHYSIPLVYAGVGNHWHENTYSTTKTSVERLLNQFRNEFHLPFATVRPMNAYGPGQVPAPPFASSQVRKITPSFVCRALAQHPDYPVEVYGDGSRISDMVYVKDVARVFVTCLENLKMGNVPPFPLEVGPREHRTTLEIAELVCDIVGVEDEVVHLDMRPGEKARPDVDPGLLPKLRDAVLGSVPRGDVRTYKKVMDLLRQLDVDVYADTSTLTEIGMWADDFTPLEVGLRETVEWFRANEGVTWHVPR